jgi:hypothetical protein
VGNVVGNDLVEKEGENEQSAVHQQGWAEQDENGSRPALERHLRQRDQVERAGKKPSHDSHPRS